MADETKKIAKITVDRNLCIGAASCIAVAPGAYVLDGENKAVLILKGGNNNSGPAEKSALEQSDISDEDLRLSAESCPTKAIFLHDEEGNQIYP